MNIWHDMPRQRVTAIKFPVYVTITKGSNKRYEFDLETGVLQLTEMLYAAVCYPVNGGIIHCLCIIKQHSKGQHLVLHLNR
ncbi:MAG: inorganic diphosphatase [Oliverpabstia sp.]